jgi:metal-responsive CopG/Arc/MetJ family transcriptional regulator
MPRTIIDIPAEQLLEVDRICRALNISRAEGVRRALHEFVRQNEDIQQEGFGLWRDAKVSGADLIDTLRGQW